MFEINLYAASKVYEEKGCLKYQRIAARGEAHPLLFNSQSVREHSPFDEVGSRILDSYRGCSYRHLGFITHINGRYIATLQPINFIFVSFYILYT
mgnify:CR=1 FL=1